MDAGCSLEDSCPPDQFAAFRAAHPDHIALTYINCSAAVKALSDIIVTSSSAQVILDQIPKDQKIIFGPDRHLGGYLARKIGREMLLWPGICIVHQAFSETELLKLKAEHPDAPVAAHPECPPHIIDHADHVGSTKSILDFALSTPAETILVATEPHIIHQMEKAAPGKTFIGVPGGDGNCNCNMCPYMALNTLEKLYVALRDLEPRIELVARGDGARPRAAGADARNGRADGRAGRCRNADHRPSRGHRSGDQRRLTRATLSLFFPLAIYDEPKTGCGARRRRSVAVGAARSSLSAGFGRGFSCALRSSCRCSRQLLLRRLRWRNHHSRPASRRASSPRTTPSAPAPASRRWRGTMRSATPPRAMRTQMAMTGRFAHSDRAARPGTGENLWMGTHGAFSVEAMVGGWSSEKRFFAPGIFPNVSRTGDWEDVGHYTQMIWPQTTQGRLRARFDRAHRLSRLPLSPIRAISTAGRSATLPADGTAWRYGS